jgi:hypothetical protein
MGTSAPSPDAAEAVSGAELVCIWNLTPAATSMFRTIKYILTLSCDEASRLTSAAMDRPLSPVERIGLRLHRLGCRFCRRYRRQLNLLRDLLRQHDARIAARADISAATLPPDARERIRQALRRNSP